MDNNEKQMTLYEINQSIISQMPSYNDMRISELKNRINEWKDEFHLDSKFFMLLCNDIHYYTVIYNNDGSTCDFSDVGEAVIELLESANYTIHSDENCEDHYEIWGKNDDQKGTVVFLLFPYDQGVVSYGK